MQRPQKVEREGTVPRAQGATQYELCLQESQTWR